MRAALPTLLLVVNACAAEPSSLDRAVLQELNAVRRNPAEFAKHLESRLRYFRGKHLELPRRIPLSTVEGAAALKEAAAVLRALEPLPQLVWSDELAGAARAHVADIGPKGLVQHESTGGASASQRIRVRLRRARTTAEAISFGPGNARDVVLDLIVDDGVRNRGHRNILLSREVNLAGVACGPHAVYGTMCVLDFAGKGI